MRIPSRFWPASARTGLCGAQETGAQETKVNVSAADDRVSRIRAAGKKGYEGDACGETTGAVYEKFHQY